MCREKIYIHLSCISLKRCLRILPCCFAFLLCYPTLWQDWVLVIGFKYVSGNGNGNSILLSYDKNTIQYFFVSVLIIIVPSEFSFLFEEVMCCWDENVHRSPCYKTQFPLIVTIQLVHVYQSVQFLHPFMYDSKESTARVLVRFSLILLIDDVFL